MPTRSYSYFTPVLDCGSEDHEVLVSVHVDSPNSSSLQAPEAFRRFRIDGVEHHAGALVIQSGLTASSPGHQQSNIAVLTLDAARAFELRARRAPDAGRSSLLDGLQ